jgi:hypothetical protein
MTKVSLYKAMMPRMESDKKCMVTIAFVALLREWEDNQWLVCYMRRGKLRVFQIVCPSIDEGGVPCTLPSIDSKGINNDGKNDLDITKGGVPCILPSADSKSINDNGKNNSDITVLLTPCMRRGGRSKSAFGSPAFMMKKLSAPAKASRLRMVSKMVSLMSSTKDTAQDKALGE